MRVAVLAHLRIIGLCVVGCMLALGCSGGDALVKKATEFHTAKIAEGDEYLAYAMELAGRGDSSFAKSLLLESAASESYGISLEATRALAKNPRPEAQDALKTIFDTKNGVIKLAAAIGLGKLGDDAGLEFVKEQVVAGTPPSEDAIEMLRQRGEAAMLENLMKRLVYSDDLTLRNEGYTILGQVAEPWSTALLRKRLGQEFGAERAGPIAALGQSGDPSVAKDLQKFINTQGLVFPTLDALAALASPDSLGAVQKLADHDEPLVASHVAATLARLGDLETASGPMNRVIESADPLAMEALASRLADVSGPQVNEALQRLANDAEGSVRAAAVRSMLAGGVADDAFLVERLGDQDFGVLSEVIERLSKGGGESALEGLAPLLDSDNPYVALGAAQAVIAIKERLAPAA